MVEKAYVDLVALDGGPPRAHGLVFFLIIGLGGWLFALHPTGFLPEEDQGYAIVVGDAARGASQPRVREVPTKSTPFSRRPRASPAG